MTKKKKTNELEMEMERSVNITAEQQRLCSNLFSSWAEGEAESTFHSCPSTRSHSAAALYNQFSIGAEQG